MRRLCDLLTKAVPLVLLAEMACREPVTTPTPPSFQAQASGNHFYVSPTGSDANPCTLSAPCLTMQGVSERLAPGDTAHFAPGDYSWDGQVVSVSGTASARVTYISDSTWRARITNTGLYQGEPACGIIKNTGDYVDIVGFDLTGPCSNGLLQDGNYGRILANRVHDLPGSGGYAGILVDCCAYTLEGNEVIGNVVDNVGPFGGTNTIHGIYVSGRNSRIENNIVTRASAACISSYHGATRLVISNNVVANCGRYGIVVSADPLITTNDYTTERGDSITSGTESGTITLTPEEFSNLFVNYTGDMHGDYHLRSGARGIDEGTTRCAEGVSDCVPATDFDGVSRPQGSAYDIGAYEAAATPGAGPVASWSFDEGSGQIASDGSGNGNTGTLGVTTALETSDPLWVPGKVNNALQFDGLSSRTTVSPSPTINNLSAFTCVAWIYPMGPGGGGYGRVFSKESSGGFDDFYFLGNGTIEAAINNTSGTQFFAMSVADALPWNTWSHVAVSYDELGDRRLHLYLNGSEVAYARQDAVSGTLRTTSNTLITGNRIAGDRSFQGKMDEAKLYDRALSATEIQSLFNSSAPSSLTLR